MSSILEILFSIFLEVTLNRCLSWGVVEKPIGFFMDSPGMSRRPGSRFDSKIGCRLHNLQSIKFHEYPIHLKMVKYLDMNHMTIYVHYIPSIDISPSPSSWILNHLHLPYISKDEVSPNLQCKWETWSWSVSLHARWGSILTELPAHTPTHAHSHTYTLDWFWNWSWFQIGSIELCVIRSARF